MSGDVTKPAMVIESRTMQELRFVIQFRAIHRRQRRRWRAKDLPQRSPGVPWEAFPVRSAAKDDRRFGGRVS